MASELSTSEVTTMYEKIKSCELCPVCLSEIPSGGWPFSNIFFHAHLKLRCALTTSLKHILKPERKNFFKKNKAIKPMGYDLKEEVEEEIKAFGDVSTNMHGENQEQNIKSSGDSVSHIGAKKRKMDCPSDKEKLEDNSADEEVDFASQDVQEAIKKLNNCLTESNMEAWRKILDRKDLTEEQYLVAVGVHLVQKLTGEAYTRQERRNLKCPCGCSNNLETTDMCIGSEDTWHGELDLLAGNKATSIRVKTSTEEIQPEDTELEEDVGTDENGSTGNSINHGIKKNDIFTGPGLCPIFAQTIVFSFTEYNRHSDKSPLIPSLLVTNKAFSAFLYNSETDELLVTRGFVPLYPLEDIPVEFRYMGIFVLWIFLNHRLFFRNTMNKRGDNASGFQGMTPESMLSKYKSLKEYKRKVEECRVGNEVILLPDCQWPFFYQ